MTLVLKERPVAAALHPAERMSKAKPGNTGGRKPARSGGVQPDAVEAFDVWLQRGLHKLYDSVANEPIPDELLKLIEEDEAKRSN